MWVWLVVFVVVCRLNRLDISIRHFRIALALLILLLAPLPRMLESLKSAGWRAARVVVWVTIALAITSILTAVRAYPYYFPFLNVLTMGRPGYALVNDSNLDWNQALPEVESFVQQHGLNQVLLDEYGFSEPTAYVPQAQFWSCQEASSSDGGRWAVVSTGSIADGHNCLWLMQYPHQVLAGGSMYAIQLPPVIPAASTPGGPPLPEAYRYLGGFPFFGPHPPPMFFTSIPDPHHLTPPIGPIQPTS